MTDTVWILIMALMIMMIWGALLKKDAPPIDPNQIQGINLNNPNMKWFLVIDKTGKMSPQRIDQAKLKDLPDSLDYVDKPLHKWLDEAQPNDRWEDLSTLMIRLHR